MLRPRPSQLLNPILLIHPEGFCCFLTGLLAKYGKKQAIKKIGAEYTINKCGEQWTGAVVYPEVVVEVEGMNCRALLNMGVGSSYASASLLSTPPKWSSSRHMTNRDDVRSHYKGSGNLLRHQSGGCRLYPEHGCDQSGQGTIAHVEKSQVPTTVEIVPTPSGSPDD